MSFVSAEFVENKVEHNVVGNCKNPGSASSVCISGNNILCHIELAGLCSAAGLFSSILHAREYVPESLSWFTVQCHESNSVLQQASRPCLETVVYFLKTSFIQFLIHTKEYEQTFMVIT